MRPATVSASGLSPGGAASRTVRGSSVAPSDGVVLLTLGEAVGGFAEVPAGSVPDVVEGPAGDPDTAFSLVTDECPVRPPPKVPLIRPNAIAETTTQGRDSNSQPLQTHVRPYLSHPLGSTRQPSTDPVAPRRCAETTGVRPS